MSGTMKKGEGPVSFIASLRTRNRPKMGEKRKRYENKESKSGVKENKNLNTRIKNCMGYNGIKPLPKKSKLILKIFNGRQH